MVLGREVKVDKSFGGISGEKSSSGTETEKAPKGRTAPTTRAALISVGCEQRRSLTTLHGCNVHICVQNIQICIRHVQHLYDISGRFVMKSNRAR